MKPYLYYAFDNLKDISDLLLSQENAQVLAGGTDLLVWIREKRVQPTCIVDIKNVDELHELSYSPEGGLKIGSAVTLTQVIEHPGVKEGYGILAESIMTIGCKQIRNKATLVGNVCTASPAGDSLTALLVLDSHVDIFGPEGNRTVPLEEFFTGPGETVLNRGEIVTGVRIGPREQGGVGHYYKNSRRKALDLAFIGVSVWGKKDGSHTDVRIGLGSVAPTPLRARNAERILRDKGFRPDVFEEAAKAAAGSCKPIDDIRATAQYRLYMVFNFVQRGLAYIHGELS